MVIIWNLNSLLMASSPNPTMLVFYLEGGYPRIPPPPPQNIEKKYIPKKNLNVKIYVTKLRIDSPA